MVRYAPKTRIAKKRVYKRKSVSKRTAKPSRKFTKMVQKVIQKNAEDKQCFRSTGNSLINFNSGIESAADIQTILPSISNGSADNQRVGDLISAKTINIKGYLNLAVDLTENTLPNRRVGVRMMVISPKRFPNADDAYANFSSWYSSLLKKGGTQTAFTGQIQDLFAPINTDEITKYYDRVFYLSQDYWKTNVGTTTVSSQSMMNIQNTIKLFNIKIPLRNKKLRYDAGVSGNDQPVNFGPVLVLGYAHLDGSSPDVVSTQVGLCYDSYFNYEDI